MKLVDTNLCLWLLHEIKVTKLQMELLEQIYDASPDTRNENLSIDLRLRIIKFKEENLGQRIVLTDKLIALNKELAGVLP